MNQFANEHEKNRQLMEDRQVGIIEFFMQIIVGGERTTSYSTLMLLCSFLCVCVFSNKADDVIKLRMYKALRWGHNIWHIYVICAVKWDYNPLVDSCGKACKVWLFPHCHTAMHSLVRDLLICKLQIHLLLLGIILYIVEGWQVGLWNLDCTIVEIVHQNLQIALLLKYA